MINQHLYNLAKEDIRKLLVTLQDEEFCEVTDADVLFVWKNGIAPILYGDTKKTQKRKRKTYNADTWS